MQDLRDMMRDLCRGPHGKTPGDAKFVDHHAGYMVPHIDCDMMRDLCGGPCSRCGDRQMLHHQMLGYVVPHIDRASRHVDLAQSVLLIIGSVWCMHQSFCMHCVLVGN